MWLEVVWLCKRSFHGFAAAWTGWLGLQCFGSNCFGFWSLEFRGNLDRRDHSHFSSAFPAGGFDHGNRFFVRLERGQGRLTLYLTFFEQFENRRSFGFRLCDDILENNRFKNNRFQNNWLENY